MGEIFHQVEHALAGHFEGLEGRHDAELLAVLVDDANLARADSFVGADEGLGGTLIDRWNRSPPQRAAWAAMSLKDWIAYLALKVAYIEKYSIMRV